MSSVLSQHTWMQLGTSILMWSILTSCIPLFHYLIHSFVVLISKYYKSVQHLRIKLKMRDCFFLVNSTVWWNCTFWRALWSTAFLYGVFWLNFLTFNILHFSFNLHFASYWAIMATSYQAVLDWVMKEILDIMMII